MSSVVRSAPAKSYSLHFAHEEAEAQTGAVRDCPGFSSPGVVVLRSAGTLGPVLLLHPRDKGFKDGLHYSE